MKSFAFCSIVAVPTCNKFEPLAQLNFKELASLPARKTKVATPPNPVQPAQQRQPTVPPAQIHGRQSPPRHQPKQTFPKVQDTYMPLAGHTIYPTNPPHTAELAVVGRSLEEGEWK